MSERPVALVTAQALAGQSIVRPDGMLLAAGWAILALSLLAAALVLAVRPRPRAAVSAA